MLTQIGIQLLIDDALNKFRYKCQIGDWPVASRRVGIKARLFENRRNER